MVQVDETYFVRDLGSMNGVWLNGERVNRESLVQIGDRVAIGDVEFLFHPNARVETKKTVAPSVDGKSSPPVAQVDGVELLDLPESEEFVANENVSQSELDDVPVVEVMDDVIALEEESDPTLKETNELEGIDEPIHDSEYSDDDDGGDSEELIVLDDD